MVFCAHGVIKTGGGGQAFVWLTHNPMNRKAVGRPPEQAEIKSRFRRFDPAFVFTSADIEPVMQSAFDSPVFAVKRQHVHGGKFIRRQTG